MKIKRTIFRQYDIRGITGVKFDKKTIERYEKIYGKFPGITIDLKVSRAIGQGLGTIIKRGGGKKIVVGFDVRPFAEELKEAFVEGVTSTGIDVFDLGKSTTPLVFFLTAFQKFDGGVNITGSHNIYFYNGFKIGKKGGASLYGEELQKLYQLILKEDFEKGKGRREKLKSGFEIYKNYILEKIKLKRKIKIVVDCGNGTPGLFAPRFLSSLGCQVLSGLYLQPNAYYPNHIPDPEEPYNLKDLGKEVVKKKAEIGIAFDADGDRVGFVDEKGNFLFADDILLLLSKDILEENPGKKVLFDVKCSSLLFQILPKLGGIPLIHKTGYALIKDTLRKDREIILGGEISGHFYFVKDYFKIDDGFFAAAKVLEILSKTRKSFSSLFSFIPKTIRTPEIKLPCPDEKKFKVVEKIKENFQKKYKTITIDGVRIVFGKNTWALVRASNTSPYLTLRFEAETKEKLLEIKNIFADELEKYSEIGDKLDRKNPYSLTGKIGYV